HRYGGAPARDGSGGVAQDPHYNNEKGGNNLTNERYERILEQDNDSLVLDLSNKIDALKSLTTGIGEEVRSQNKFLDGMQENFAGASDLLGGAMKRLQVVAAKGGGLMCYLMLFVLFVMLVMRSDQSDGYRHGGIACALQSGTGPGNCETVGQPFSSTAVVVFTSDGVGMVRHQDDIHSIVKEFELGVTSRCHGYPGVFSNYPMTRMERESRKILQLGEIWVPIDSGCQ
ncbi:hypothetical protein SARC_09154, partial [Sphaeroforma arctica JP610]